MHKAKTQSTWLRKERKKDGVMRERREEKRKGMPSAGSRVLLEEEKNMIQIIWLVTGYTAIGWSLGFTGTNCIESAQEKTHTDSYFRKHNWVRVSRQCLVRGESSENGDWGNKNSGKEKVEVTRVTRLLVGSGIILAPAATLPSRVHNSYIILKHVI